MAAFQTFNSFSLSQDQEDLLMAALNQPASGTTNNTNNSLSPPTRDVFNFSNGSLESPLFGNSPTQNNDIMDTDFSTMTDQQFLEFMENGGVPHDDVDHEDSPDSNGLEVSSRDLHDKRKSFIGNLDDDDDDDDEENAPKRREGDDKQPKKPGRKPLTSEPTSKRKAQNRAAQRAFRERKERHLKDLETKVTELEKQSESQNHENSLLRAQVERQQTELRAYKKRLSTQSSIGSFSMPSAPASTSIVPNTFNFDFPQFSSLSYLPIDTSTGNGQGLFDVNLTASPSPASRQGSTDLLSGITMAPSPASTDAYRSLHNSISAESPVNKASTRSPSVWGVQIRDYNIFSPTGNIDVSASSPAASVSALSTTTPTGTTDDARRANFVFNAVADSSGSPSTPSTSQVNGSSSSCGTSPESTAHTTTSIKEEQQSPAKPEPLTPATNSQDVNLSSNTQDFGIFSNTNIMPTGAENQPLWMSMPTNLMGDGSFTGGFFNDTMPGQFDDSPMDWSDLIGGGNATKTGLTPWPRGNPMEEVSVLPSISESQQADHKTDANPEQKGTAMACNKIWESIKGNPRFQNVDDSAMEELCVELRKKAKCSESGPVIDQKDIDAALERSLASLEATS